MTSVSGEICKANQFHYTGVIIEKPTLCFDVQVIYDGSTNPETLFPQ